MWEFPLEDLQRVKNKTSSLSCAWIYLAFYTATVFRKSQALRLEYSDMEKLGFAISKAQFYRARKVLEETGFLKTVDMVLRNGRERKVYELSERKNEFSKHS